MSPANISIIVPCWRGDAVSAAVAAEWLRSGVVREIITAEAEEADAPAPGIPAVPGVRRVRCPRQGRGSQMNHAARLAVGETLLFHHADTELTDAHLQSLAASLADPTVAGGAFCRRFDERHPRLRWIEPWEALRCRLFGPLFGDQSLFVRRVVFEELGGYADIPLMEDVEFSRRLRRRFRLTLLKPAIASSPRKHIQQGRWRTTLTNALFLLLHLCGVPPRRLHLWYYRGFLKPGKTS